MFTVLRRVSIPLTLASEVYILSMPTTRNIVAAVALLMSGSFVAALNDLSLNVLGYTPVLIPLLQPARTERVQDEALRP